MSNATNAPPIHIGSYSSMVGSSKLIISRHLFVTHEQDHPNFFCTYCYKYPHKFISPSRGAYNAQREFILGRGSVGGEGVKWWHNFYKFQQPKTPRGTYIHSNLYNLHKFCSNQTSTNQGKIPNSRPKSSSHQRVVCQPDEEQANQDVPNISMRIDEAYHIDQPTTPPSPLSPSLSSHIEENECGESEGYMGRKQTCMNTAWCRRGCRCGGGGVPCEMTQEERTQLCPKIKSNIHSCL